MGATAVGIACKEGVVLASEKRLAYGTFVASRNVMKVFKINDRVGMACAGLIGDVQLLLRELRYNVNLYQYMYVRRIHPRSVARILSLLLQSRRLFPMIAQIVIGGIDDEGKARVYSLDPLGSVIEDNYTAVGTGTEIAIGVVESYYRPDMSIDEAKELAIRAIKRAVSRDAMSGDGIDIIIITKEGIRTESVPLTST
ncbi:archaeal proteasome endopeptidase complex subunit beta [archaeon]|nr:archaeal proteasome endopeptidase complex subunit beta [archaeon]